MSMSEAETLHELELVGAIVTGSHVVYTSGMHGPDYVAKDAIYPHPSLTATLSQNLAKHFVRDRIEVVIVPAVGAIILGQWIAYYLNSMTDQPVLSVYAEKDTVPLPRMMGSYDKNYTETGNFVFNRGYGELIKNKRGLIIEDNVTTGGSVSKVIKASRQLDCDIVAVGALCNRGGITAEMLNVPRFEALLNIKLDAWPAADCPLCRAGVPINITVGKGREFLARQAAK